MENTATSVGSDVTGSIEELTLGTVLQSPTPNNSDSSGSRMRFSLKRAYFATFGASMSVRLLGAVSGILAARLLGPVGRGELAIITLLPTMLLPIGELELPRALAFEISKRGSATARIISTGLWLSVGLGCIQMILLAAALRLFLPPDKIYVLHASRMFTLYLPAVFVLTCLAGVDQGRGLFGRFSVLQGVPGLIYVVTIAAGYLAGCISPNLFAIGIFLGALVPAVLRIAVEGSGVWRVAPDWTTTRLLLARGLKFYLPALTALALSRADLFLLVRLVPTTQIGFYIVAQSIAIGQMGSINPFVQVGFTAVASEVRQRDALLTLARQFRLAQVAVFTTGLVIATIAPLIIRIAFGSKFAGALSTTYLLISAAIFLGLGQLLDQGLRAAGYSRAGFMGNMLGLLVLCILGVPGATRFGIVGLSMADLLAAMFAVGALILYCTLKLKMSPSAFWAFDARTFHEIARGLRSVLSRYFPSSILKWDHENA